MAGQFFVIADNVLIATVNYLVTRPYKEVADIIDALRQCTSLPVQEHGTTNPTESTTEKTKEDASPSPVSGEKRVVPMKKKTKGGQTEQTQS